jgi:hypothetical protein
VLDTHLRESEAVLAVTDVTIRLWKTCTTAGGKFAKEQLHQGKWLMNDFS